MKNLRRMCATAALTCVLAVAARAGDISAGGVITPPPPTAVTSEAAPRMAGAGGVTIDLMVALFQAALSVL